KERRFVIAVVFSSAIWKSPLLVRAAGVHLALCFVRQLKDYVSVKRLRDSPLQNGLGMLLVPGYGRFAESGRGESAPEKDPGMGAGEKAYRAHVRVRRLFRIDRFCEWRRGSCRG